MLPAEHVLDPGDRIVSIDGKTPTFGGSSPSNDDLDKRAQALIAQVNTHRCPGTPADKCRAATPAVFVVIRDGKRVTLQATPFYDSHATRPERGSRPALSPWLRLPGRRDGA